MSHKVHAKIEEQKHSEIYVNSWLTQIRQRALILVTSNWKFDNMGCWQRKQARHVWPGNNDWGIRKTIYSFSHDSIKFEENI